MRAAASASRRESMAPVNPQSLRIECLGVSVHERLKRGNGNVASSVHDSDLPGCVRRCRVHRPGFAWRYGGFSGGFSIGTNHADLPELAVPATHADGNGTAAAA